MKQAPTQPRKPETTGYSTADSAELYGINYWSNGYFVVNPRGLIAVRPEPEIKNSPTAAILPIVQDLIAEGYPLPFTLRFPQILENRIQKLNLVFRRAIDKFDYQAHYQGVYPIKVNQQKLVVNTVARAGNPFRLGLEAGSKPELALCLAQDLNPESLLCCNGFKDDGFIQMALWALKLGKQVMITLEKPAELDRVLRISRELGIRPSLGVRFKLHSRGSGKWEESGGDLAKFGLTSSELIRVTQTLREADMLDCLRMLHCHVGSQITDIRRIKVAVREIARTYVELYRMGAHIRYVNVGGGLAVDYDGSKTTFYASANYGMQEYADDVVYSVAEICDEMEVPHPVLVSESGRALAAHHSVVVLPVIDVIGPSAESVELPELGADPHTLIVEMQDLLKDVRVKNYREIYYDAMSHKETMHSLFDLGYLSLIERAHIEALFSKIMVRVAQVIRGLEYVPEEFEVLAKLLADQYVCNFSVFQSLPDHWAIQALFPAVPIGRLDERPDRQATLVDITCDSDGKVDKFVDLRDVKPVLPLHPVEAEENYYIGLFLTGAYQDVLASTHNLFGRVNEAHVRVTGPDQFKIERVVEGQRARQVIENMGYHSSSLLQAVFTSIKDARERGDISAEHARQLRETYQAELLGYTYLEE